jgi:hypothetical protein
MLQPLSPDHYMAKLNEFLRAHEDYREGMVFVPSPEGTTGNAMWGYEIPAIHRNDLALHGIYVQAAHRVQKEFFVVT